MQAAFGMDQVLATLHIEVLQAFAQSAWAPWTTPDQVFNDAFSRLFWVQGGEAWAEHHGRNIMLRPGHLYAIPAHTPLRLGCDDRMHFCWMHLIAEVLHGIDLFTFLGEGAEMVIDDPEWMEGLWTQLMGRLGPTPGDRLAREGLARQLLAICFDHADPATPEQHLHGIVCFQPVLAYIEQRLPAPISLPELATVAHMQPTYFSSQFTRHLGERPMAYLIRRRVERAKRLLHNSDATLASVAGAVGFCDEYYFSRCFKRVTHLTPGQYRRQHHCAERP